MNFENRNSEQLNFLGYQIWQRTVDKISIFHLHIQLKSKQKVKTSYI